MKPLIIYFTTTYNTAKVVNLMQEVLGCEKELLRPIDPYIDNVMDRSKMEIETGMATEIHPLTHRLGDFDTVILATPVWWLNASSPIIALIRSGVLKGKDVYPVITTGFDVNGVEEKIDDMLLGSKIHKALIVPFENAFLSKENEEMIKEYSKNIR